MITLDPAGKCPASWHLSTDGRLLSGVGTEVGTYLAEERRIAYQWEALGASSELIALAKSEEEAFNRYTRGISAKLRGRADNERIYNLELWRHRYPLVKAIEQLSEVELCLNKKSILDIGGTGKDMPYWIGESPLRIDQVEVSAGSQAEALARLQSRFAPTVFTESAPVYFHTVPAEHLPFEDESFDFVFSRATLHHCQRPACIDEALRVLRPGGVFLFIERCLSTPVYLAMRLQRRLFRMERGTDDPLQISELEYAQTLLRHSAYIRYGALDVLSYFPRRLMSGHRTEPGRSGGGHLDQWFGGGVIFLGVK